VSVSRNGNLSEVADSGDIIMHLLKTRIYEGLVEFPEKTRPTLSLVRGDLFSHRGPQCSRHELDKLWLLLPTLGGF